MCWFSFECPAINVQRITVHEKEVRFLKTTQSPKTGPFHPECWTEWSSYSSLLGRLETHPRHWTETWDAASTLFNTCHRGFTPSPLRASGGPRLQLLLSSSSTWEVVSRLGCLAFSFEEEEEVGVLQLAWPLPLFWLLSGGGGGR